MSRFYAMEKQTSKRQNIDIYKLTINVKLAFFVHRSFCFTVAFPRPCCNKKYTLKALAVLYNTQGNNLWPSQSSRRHTRYYCPLLGAFTLPVLSPCHVGSIDFKRMNEWYGISKGFVRVPKTRMIVTVVFFKWYQFIWKSVFLV